MNSLKLSPNLRLRHEPVDEEGNPIEHDDMALQREHMERLLQTADAKPPSV